MAFDQQNMETLNAFLPSDIRQEPKDDREAIQRQQDMHTAARLSNPNIKGDILPTEPPEAKYSTIGGTDAPIFGDEYFHVARSGVRKPVPYVNTSTEYSMAKGLKSKAEVEEDNKKEQETKNKINTLAPRSGVNTIQDVSQPELDETSIVGQPEANLTSFFTDYKDTFSQAAEVVTGLGEDQNLTDREKQTVYRNYVDRMGKDDESGFFDNGGREALISFGLSTLANNGDIRQGLVSGFQTYGNVQSKQERIRQGQATLEDARNSGYQVTPSQEQAMAAWAESGDDKLIPEFSNESDQYKTTFTDANGNVTAIMQRPDGTTYTQIMGQGATKPKESFGAIQLDPQTGEYGQYDQSGQFHRIISGKQSGSGDTSNVATINSDNSINYVGMDKPLDANQEKLVNSGEVVAGSLGQLNNQLGYAKNTGTLVSAADRAMPKFLQSKEGQVWKNSMATYKNVMINALSGAAVSDGEAQRLMEELQADDFGTKPEVAQRVFNKVTSFAAKHDWRLATNAYGGRTQQVRSQIVRAIDNPDVDIATLTPEGNILIKYKEGTPKYKELEKRRGKGSGGKFIEINPDNVYRALQSKKK